MSLFSSTAMYYQAPAAPAGPTYSIRPDEFSGSVVLAMPGTQFSTFGMANYYSDISATIRGTGSNISIVPTGSAGGQIYPSASLVNSGSYNFSTSGGYTSAMFSSGSQNIGYFPASALTFGSGNFVIEYWVQYKSAYTSPPFNKGGLVSQGGAQNQIFDFNGVNNRYRIYYNDGGTFVNVTWAQNIWYHIAFVRTGTTITVFVNGRAAATTATVSGTMSAPTAWSLMGVNSGGTADGAATLFNDFRVTIGSNRNYTASFSPPNSIVQVS
jgi:hypothetical protein